MAPFPSKGPKKQINHQAAIIGALRARDPIEYISKRYPHIPKEKIRKWIAGQVADIKLYNAQVASERKTNPAMARKTTRLDSSLKKLQMQAAAEELGDLSAQHGRGKRIWKRTWKSVRPEMNN